MGLYPLDAPVEVSIAAWPWGAYLGEEGKRRGVRAKVASWRRIPHDSLIPHAKASGQYLNSVLAKVEASKAGYQEAILLDHHGFVCEGSGENIYVVRDGKIATPPRHGRDPRRDHPPLDHQDRRRPGLEVVERDVARAELYLADEVFLTGTAAELVPVREVDDHAIGGGAPRRTGGPGRSPASSSASTTTRFTGAIRATRAGSTWSRFRPGSRPGPPSPSDGLLMSRIELYDTTLRDGMQGEGMSLSAQEKLRVAHRLDELGIDLIEAGFPSSNPKELELFELLAAEQLRPCGDRRVRDDPPARRHG